ncbi:hypothetical protein D3C77_554100 [compost metagenome]
MNGEVINVQFQGKEFNYDIRAAGQQWEVVSPLPFKIHDKVSLHISTVIPALISSGAVNTVNGAASYAVPQEELQYV